MGDWAALQCAKQGQSSATMSGIETETTWNSPFIKAAILYDRLSVWFVLAGCWLRASDLPVLHSKWLSLHIGPFSHSFPAIADDPRWRSRPQFECTNSGWYLGECVWVTRTTCFLGNGIRTSLRPWLLLLSMLYQGPVYLIKMGQECLLLTSCDIAPVGASCLFEALKKKIFT